MSKLHLIFDNKYKTVEFSKEDRMYYSNITRLSNSLLPEIIVITNKMGNFDLTFSNRKQIIKDGVLCSYIYELENDERGITYRLYF